MRIQRVFYPGSHGLRRGAGSLYALEFWRMSYPASHGLLRGAGSLYALHSCRMSYPASHGLRRGAGSFCCAMPIYHLVERMSS